MAVAMENSSQDIKLPLSFYRFTSLGSQMNYSIGEYYINLPLWAIIILAILFYFLVKIFFIILNGTKQSKFIEKIEITKLDNIKSIRFLFNKIIINLLVLIYFMIKKI